MNFLFLWIALLVALLDWIAVAMNWKTLEYFAKPGVMLALLAWMWQSGAISGQATWFAAGLIFSLAGDIFLMLPAEQFIAGLVAFLLAHLAYLVGFNPTPPPLNLASLIPAVLLGLVAGQIYRGVAAGLAASNNDNLRLPVLVYSGAISLMLLSALLTLVRDEWNAGPALLVSAGALLFFLSDTFLAWNKFVVPLTYGKLRVIITYHLGQILIVIGAMTHFLKIL
jgi:uncharacterized membrane protein YhhN